MSDENKIKNDNVPVKIGAQPDNSTQSSGTDWMEDKAYIPETPYLQFDLGEFTKFWIPKAQAGTEGAFQPKVEIMLDEKSQPVYNEYKDGEGNIINKVVVKKATWQVINKDGKKKIYSCTVGGAKSIFAKIKSRIKEATKENKEFLGLKIKKTGAGLLTVYDIETNPEPCVEVKG